MELVIDFETTGLLEDDEVIQCSLLVLEDGRIIKGINRFYLPKFKSLSDYNIKVQGITYDKLKRLTEDNKYKYFEDDIEIHSLILEADRIISHNIDFEMQFLRRYVSEDLVNYDTFCTMRRYTSILKIPSVEWVYKYPKLSEVIDFLSYSEHEDFREVIRKMAREIWGVSDIDYHDSRFDVIATYIAYMKYKKYRDIELKLIRFNKILDEIEMYSDSIMMKVHYSSDKNRLYSKALEFLHNFVYYRIGNVYIKRLFLKFLCFLFCR